MRTLFSVYVESKNCYVMVKPGKMAIEIHTKSKGGKGGWTFFKNIPFTYSKQQLKLNGGKQRSELKFIDVAKLSVPDNY